MAEEVTEQQPAAQESPLSAFSLDNLRVNVGGQTIAATPTAPISNEEPKPEEEKKPEELKPEEEPKQPEKPSEPEKPANPDEEAIPQEERKKWSSKTRENFDRLSTEARKAREERDRLQKEHEEARKRLAEYEEKLKNPVVPEDLQKQLQEREAKLQELQNELRFVNLERDPEFVARFSTDHLTGAMKELAQSAGVEEAAFQRALRNGNEDQLADIRDSLQPAQQRRWDAALLQMEQVNLQKQQALQNRDRTWAEIQQAREQQWQQQVQMQTKENISLAEQTFQKMVEITPLFQEDEEAKEQARKVAIAMAGGEGADKFTKETILQWGMANVALARAKKLQDEVIEGQQSKITEYEEKMKELESKLKERDEFIEKRHGGMPSNRPSSSSSATRSETSEVPVWDRIVVAR